jgi:hypothetical protein
MNPLNETNVSVRLDTLEASREGFEEWALKTGFINEDRKRNKDGTYFNHNAELCWCVWQAALDFARSRETALKDAAYSAGMTDGRRNYRMEKEYAEDKVRTLEAALREAKK